MPGVGAEIIWAAGVGAVKAAGVIGIICAPGVGAASYGVGAVFGPGVLTLFLSLLLRHAFGVGQSSSFAAPHLLAESEAAGVRAPAFQWSSATLLLLGVLLPESHAGVLAPAGVLGASIVAYGFGVRAPAFQAGVLDPSIE